MVLFGDVLDQVETAEPEEMDELDSLPGSEDDASDGMASEDDE